jgi:hypothetical protein
MLALDGAWEGSLAHRLQPSFYAFKIYYDIN